MEARKVGRLLNGTRSNAFGGVRRCLIQWKDRVRILTMCRPRDISVEQLSREERLIDSPTRYDSIHWLRSEVSSPAWGTSRKDRGSGVGLRRLGWLLRLADPDDDDPPGTRCKWLSVMNLYSRHLLKTPSSTETRDTFFAPPQPPKPEINRHRT